MKRILKAVVVSALVAGAQAAVADSFPGNGEVVFLPAQSTYADRNGGGAALATGESIPGNGEVVFMAPLSTNADRISPDNVMAGDPYPGNGEVVFLPAQWTYADRAAPTHQAQAGGASDPALSQ